MAIALTGEAAPAAEWAALARQYRGDDRWYLEALGIAAAKHWDDCLSAYLKLLPGAASTKAGRDIIWRSRAEETPELLAKIIVDPATPAEELPRYFRAFDFLSGDKKRAAIERLAFHTERRGSSSPGPDRFGSGEPARGERGLAASGESLRLG